MGTCVSMCTTVCACARVLVQSARASNWVVLGSDQFIARNGGSPIEYFPGGAGVHWNGGTSLTT